MAAGKAKQRWLAPATVAIGLAPLAKLGVAAFTGGLGANPIAEGMNRLGFWTLTFLSLSLAPTPAKDFLGLGWPVRIRRTLGLLAFGYGALHFAWYLVLDKFFDAADIGADIAKRPFITVGFAALLVLVPLAVTSTDRWVRRLGYPRWKALHRLVYLAAALAVVHFLWRVKADKLKPTIFAAIIGALLALRVVAYARRRLRERARRDSVAMAR
ncbi:MAG TPA: protein-methionine-sulfoxide reductase heme-binding subunit MsrQ [Anaeromyxobacteraceae bacterium]|nr:protein-methionine-sulfoxide reductase heme-binding subunit MsrQ [Anaeromyxobacteraceae bacterium]